MTQSAVDAGQDLIGDSLVRYDVRSGAVDVIEFGPGRSIGEAVFVPRADDAAEDDGWYLTLVHDRATDRSSLAVLDAGDPTAGPIAEVHLPTRVPVGFLPEFRTTAMPQYPRESAPVRSITSG